MESEENENLIIGAFIKRNDPRDALVGKIKKLNELRDGFKIGTCSRRRNFN